MPFIPHTAQDEALMLEKIGLKHLCDLFTEIPKALIIDSLSGIPAGLSEMQVSRLMKERSEQIQKGLCFIGAGAYQHHIPSVVWDIAMRGEYLTAYTPYQAEANQGTLQLIWEYQTMIASLMGKEVANASMYDGATALVEAILMASRIQGNSATVWVPQTLSPFYRQVLKTMLFSKLDIVEISYDQTGVTTTRDLNTLKSQGGQCSILVIAQPNFFGRLEPVDELCDWGHQQNALVIGVVNPLAMAWLKPPGQWGVKGADIACGEGQPLGIPLSSGGPYFGFLCSNKAYVRQLPGRVVGKTVDKTGKAGFTLTLQAREQHIRREKATSNICTNQGLLVTAATIYMSLMGAQGLKQIAQCCYARCQFLIAALHDAGINIVFPGLHFHEVVIQLPMNVQTILYQLAKKEIAGGFNLQTAYPNLKESLLVCVTETKTDEDILFFVDCLKQILKG
ncbi:MAG: aminomethyl-transferring glycine dehydrogenase subunit GcvPA [Proteobacteria bacterium]|nr:aminomethyl-transferring glycine dehydrogenase subunit GcvPA [Pseudomonadota bacterium]